MCGFTARFSCENSDMKMEQCAVIHCFVQKGKVRRKQLTSYVMFTPKMNYSGINHLLVA